MNTDDMGETTSLGHPNNGREVDLKQALNSLDNPFNPSTPVVITTAYNNRNNQFTTVLQNQIKDILYLEPRKDDLEILKEKISHGGIISSYQIHHHEVMNHSTSVDNSAELSSLSNLQTSPTTHHHDSFHTVGIPLSDRASSSCENSLSELTPTIIAPVNLIENSDSLIFDSSSSMKDVFASFPKDLPKDESKSSNIITSNRLLNKLIQSYKPDTTTHLPLRISEFSKIPNASLRPIIPHNCTTNAPNFRGTINKAISSVTPMHEVCTISSQQQQNPSDALHHSHAPVMDTNNINHNMNGNQNLHSTAVTNSNLHHPGVSNASIHHTIAGNSNNILSSVVRNSDVIPHTNVTTESLQQALPIHMNNSSSTLHNIITTACNTETSFSGHFANRGQSSGFPILTEINKDQKGHIESTIKESGYMNSDPRHDQLISAPTPHPPISSIGVNSALNYIQDETHDDILAQYEISSDGSKDNRTLRPEDLFLPDLHSPDDNELLEMPMDTDIESNLTTNASRVVSGPIQSSSGLGNGSSSLPELSPSPILANISSSDFLLPKNSPSQSFISMENEFSFFSNLFDSPALCMEGGFLSENDATMHAPSHPHPFVRGGIESPRKGADLNFTNAFKGSSSSSQLSLSLLNDSGRFILKGNHDISKGSSDHDTEMSSSLPKLTMCISPSTDDVFKVPPPHLPDASKTKSVLRDEVVLISSPSRDAKVVSPKPTKDDSMPMVQVSCFKCQICSFLSLDKGEMSEHTRLNHVKKKDEDVSDITFKPPINFPVSKKRKGSPLPSPNVKTETHFNSIELVSALIKDETKETKSEEKSKQKMQTRVKTQLKKINYKLSSPESSRDEDSNPDDPDFVPTTDIKIEKSLPTSAASYSQNSSLVKTTPKSRPGRPQSSQTTGLIKFKKNNPKESIPSSMSGIRCGIDGCGLRLQMEDHLLYHRKCHVGAFLSCPECKVQFAQWSNLAMHLWRIHIIDIGLHKCEKCDYKAYSLTKLMNNHFRTHSDERPFLCDICGKDFKIAKQLRSHKTLHTGKKEELKHHCDMCKRKFVEKRMLLSHLETVHRKIKPYLCNYCGNSFASKSTLNLHIRKHTGEKPFACDHCNYRTSDHNSMRRHRMKHTNDKRYSCPYCDYTSIQSSTFKVHLRRNHDIQAQKDGVIFSCPSCPFKTVKQDNILAHMGTCHQPTKEEEEMGDGSAKEHEINPNKIENPIQFAIEDNNHVPTVQGVCNDAPEVFIVSDEEEMTIAKSSLDSVSKLVSTTGSFSHNGENFIPVQSSYRNGQAQTFYVVGELVPMPQVVNIDVNNDTSTNQNNRIAYQPCNVTNQIQAPIFMTNGGDQFVEMRLMNLNDGMVQLTPEVVAMRVNSDVPASAVDNTQNILYIESSNAEGEPSTNVS